MNWPAAAVCVALVFMFMTAILGIIFNSNLATVEETKQMTACVQSGGQWLEAEGMSSKMECVK